MKIASHYALSQKLEAFKSPYLSAVGQPLYFCRASANEAIFTTVFQPTQDRIQLDLFFDNAAAFTESKLVSAIVDKNRQDIPDLLAKLKSSSPEKYHQFTQLIGFEQQIAESKETTDGKIELLMQSVTPLAFEILGRYAHDFLTPLWQTLSAEVAGQRFDAEIPECHLSYTAFKGFQWQQVGTSIQQDQDWINQPILLFRYAEACYKLNNESGGKSKWFYLFSLFPEDAERMIELTGNRLMLVDWKSFSELDPELDPCLFPCWMMIRKPALANYASVSDCASNNLLRLIKSLVSQSANEINETIIQLRSRLQRENPALFIHYMRANQSD